MSIGEIHKDDIGVRFKPLVKDENGAVKNISTATLTQLIFQKPDGSVLTKTASFYTDGSDGYLIYDSVAGDLDTIGTWSVQGYVEFGSGAQTLHSDIYEFKIHKNLPR